LELRTFYYDPGYCLSSGGSPAVLAMTIRSNTDLGRCAETHLATITATSNFILFHAGHRKLGMSNRSRDNLLVGEPRKRVQEIIADNLSKAGWTWSRVAPVDCCRRTSFFGSVLFSYFPFCSFNRCSACRCSVCRLAMTKWLFSP
jgi:hypothetical protein